jgi:hypothetical protein
MLGQPRIGRRRVFLFLVCVGALAMTIIVSCAVFVTASRCRLASVKRRTRDVQEHVFQELLRDLRARRADTVGLHGDTFDGIDEKLHRLTSIPHIKTIVLENTDVTDDGLNDLSAFTRLETLAFLGASVGDGGIQHLEGNTSLTNLSLVETAVTPKGLVVLRSLQNLRFLCFYREVNGSLDARVLGDSILCAIMELRQLRELEIGGDWLTDDMMLRLNKALPGVRIRPEKVPGTVVSAPESFPHVATGQALPSRDSGR